MAPNKIEELEKTVELMERSLGEKPGAARYLAAYATVAHQFRREIADPRDLLISQAAALTLAQRLAAQGV